MRSPTLHHHIIIIASAVASDYLGGKWSDTSFSQNQNEEQILNNHIRIYPSSLNKKV
jgi:hypothetical protein